MVHYRLENLQQKNRLNDVQATLAFFRTYAARDKKVAKLSEPTKKETKAATPRTGGGGRVFGGFGRRVSDGY